MLFYLALFTACAAQELGWDYSFPYAQNNSCDCQEVPAVGDYYISKDDCLVAMARDKYQWCQHDGQGITNSQCQDAVSIVPGVSNDVCHASCTNLVAGTLSFEKFSEGCKFNFWADFGDEVATG
eukprot:Protomagalhaensia_sp_Gyna_25__4012@NODE_3616_length_510_cov_762_895966_g3059_i0_p1_GENE_NODE_3616_length_510_cov_762_895966_g3059_i0NODE_3616_length_510_cov_762_895966_g3059_i0_p1_ORF_typecomplete_len124_score11_05_NODE_3616_length_510_cov_762_895966_g3059_i039410